MTATPRSIIDSFASLLTIAVHTILAQRSLYPPTTFLTTRSQYGFPVRQNRHPGVCAWIHQAVNAVREELESGSGVERVVVAIFAPRRRDPTTQPKGPFSDIPKLLVLERFVFDVSHLPCVPKSHLDMPIRSAGTSGTHDPPLQEQLRALLSRLSTSASSLRPFDDSKLGERSFSIVIEMADDQAVHGIDCGSNSHRNRATSPTTPAFSAPAWAGGGDGSGLWAPVAPDFDSHGTTIDHDDYEINLESGLGAGDDNDNDNDDTVVHPVRSVRSERENIAFELWIEERTTKWK